jgi:hypothetical protein
MSSLFRGYVASVRPRGKPFRSRSMVLCFAGHRPVLSRGRNARRQGLKTTFALLCPRSPCLTPRSLHWLLNSGLLDNLNPTKLVCFSSIKPSKTIPSLRGRAEASSEPQAKNLRPHHSPRNLRCFAEFILSAAEGLSMIWAVLRIATQHFKRGDLTGSDDCVRRPRPVPATLGDSSMCVKLMSDKG